MIFLNLSYNRSHFGIMLKLGFHLCLKIVLINGISVKMPFVSETTPTHVDPFYGLVGKEECTKSRSNDQHEGFLPRFGSLGSVKP